MDKRYTRYALAWQTRHLQDVMDSKTADGNFVDISLKATVMSAADTLIIFKPENKHGTVGKGQLYSVTCVGS